MKVTVVDYGAGNTLSVCRALHHCGAQVSLERDAHESERADRLVLPGVGAFGACMAALEKCAHVAAVTQFINSQRPLLGICVGMQVLYQLGTEFEEVEGFGVLQGTVEALSPESAEGEPHKVPHIGWTELLFPDHRPTGKRSILDDLVEHASAYYVHSYHCKPKAGEDVLAYADYDGQTLTAAVQKDNIIGCQFHPEKSGEVGLAILRNFLGLKTDKS